MSLLDENIWKRLLENDSKLKDLAVKAGVENNAQRAQELSRCLAINCGEGVVKSKEELETKKQEETKKKSLYDTVIIKLDDIINNRKALKSVSALKVVWMDEPSHIHDKKKRFAKVKDITKTRTFTLNVDSEERSRSSRKSF